MAMNPKGIKKKKKKSNSKTKREGKKLAGEIVNER
jgi:hypothetical protein